MQNGAVAPPHGAPGHQHVDVQQQVIITKNGMAVQVVRIVQTGPERQINLKQVEQHVEEKDEKTKEEEEKKEKREGEEGGKEEVKDGEMVGKADDSQKQEQEEQQASQDQPKTDPPSKLEGIVGQMDNIMVTGPPKKPEKPKAKEQVLKVDHEPKVVFDKDGTHKHDIVKEEVKRLFIPKDVPATTTPKMPPQSIFRSLGPSRHRYTILKDEL